MFWILRRTGAVNFFNSINNNNTASKSGTNNNNYSEKNNQRPPRKAYGRLSVDSDDTHSMRRGLDDPLSSDIDNRAYNTLEQSTQKHNGNKTDHHGNIIDESDSDLEFDRTIKNETRNRRIDEHTISRLQAMAMSDDDDYDESLTCNVCDRAFHCHRQLASHQQKKRHFGCSGCDSLFPSLMLLEHHKEEFEHWSDGEDEHRRLSCCRRNRGGGGSGGVDDDFTDTETATSDAESEDLERLL